MIEKVNCPLCGRVDSIFRKMTFDGDGTECVERGSGFCTKCNKSYEFEAATQTKQIITRFTIKVTN